MKLLIKDFLSFRFFFTTAIVTVLYLLLSTLLINYRLFIELYNDQAAMGYKLSLTYLLFIGSFQEKSMGENLLTIATAILFGVNILLIIKTIQARSVKGASHITFSSAMAISLLTSGCASCGVTLLSFVGPTIAASFIPFHALQIQVIVISLLLFSIIYTLRGLHTETCKLRSKTSYQKDK